MVSIRIWTRKVKSWTARIHLVLGIITALSLNLSGVAFADGNARGLAPSRDATYMPDLGGLLNKTYHNQYGQKRDLSECIVLRGSQIKGSLMQKLLK